MVAVGLHSGQYTFASATTDHIFCPGCAVLSAFSEATVGALRSFGEKTREPPLSTVLHGSCPKHVRPYTAAPLAPDFVQGSAAALTSRTWEGRATHCMLISPLQGNSNSSVGGFHDKKITAAIWTRLSAEKRASTSISAHFLVQSSRRKRPEGHPL